MASNPLWLKAVLRLERAVGEPLETVLRSDAYFDTVAGANRLVARAVRSAESLSSQWLHLWNLPTFSDIRGVREQLARLERDVADVARNLADVEERTAAPLVNLNDEAPRLAADINPD